jgi:hypothetical protein
MPKLSPKKLRREFQKKVKREFKKAESKKEKEFLERKLKEMNLADYALEQANELKKEYPDLRTRAHLLAAALQRRIIERLDIPITAKRKISRYMDAATWVSEMNRKNVLRPNNVIKVLDVYIEALNLRSMQKNIGREELERIKHAADDARFNIKEIRRIPMPMTFGSPKTWNDLFTATQYLIRKTAGDKNALLAFDAIKKSKSIRYKLQSENKL